MLPQHSSESNEWYTPPAIVELASRSLGGSIDLDPASSSEANRVVKARRIFTVTDEALFRSWEAETIFVNPPGGRTNPDEKVPHPHEPRKRIPLAPEVKASRESACEYMAKNGFYTLSMAAVFWNRAVRAYLDGECGRIFFVGFNLEMLRASQNSPAPMLQFPFCVPSARIRFDRVTALGVRWTPPSPAHANVLSFISQADDAVPFVQSCLDYGVGAVVSPRKWER